MTAPTPSQRRDWSDLTPAFRLSDEQIAVCHAQAKLGWLDATLEQMAREHAYDYRPWHGLANSLNSAGDIAFSDDWTANREQHMAAAYSEWQRVNAPVWRKVA